MIDLIVFSVANNRYALSIDKIVRILQDYNLTSVPTSHEYIDGIISYEDSIIKVLDFRKLIGIRSYDDKLIELFEKLKTTHILWIEALENYLKNDVEFTKTLNPHLCDLGKWIDDFTCYNDEFSILLSKLTLEHNKLHTKGAEVIEIHETDKSKALEIFNTDIKKAYDNTLNYLDIFINNTTMISSSLQKLLIYESNEKIFALKIDKIEDIAHVEESDIMMGDDEHSSSEYLDTSGVLDLDGVLINVIEALRLPK